MANYLSDNFFHFVGGRDPSDHPGNYTTLKSILASGKILDPSKNAGISIKRDLAQSLRSGKLLLPGMVCVADIPMESLGIHTAKYGWFGIGLPKDHCIFWGARPVMYLPLRADDPRLGGLTHGVDLDDIEATYRAFLKYFIDPRTTATRSRTVGKINSMDEAIDGLQTTLEKNFLAYLKVYDSDLPNDHPSCYYAEREWRSLIEIGFRPQDVGVIAVHKTFEKQALADFPAFRDRLHVIG